MLPSLRSTAADIPLCGYAHEHTSENRRFARLSSNHLRSFMSAYTKGELKLENNCALSMRTRVANSDFVVVAVESDPHAITWERGQQ
jgi:hypothetical protein